MVPSQYEVLSLNEIGQLEEIPEPGQTMEENSKLKAEFVFNKYAMSVFADDSGLEIDALDGAPGVYSARYAGEEKNHYANIERVLKELDGVSERAARFKAVITHMNEAGVANQFVGTVEGTITTERIGSRGFGYDPIFIPNGHQRTFAQMTSEEKNQMSHRARALKQFIDFLAK